MFGRGHPVILTAGTIVLAASPEDSTRLRTFG